METIPVTYGRNSYWIGDIAYIVSCLYQEYIYVLKISIPVYMLLLDKPLLQEHMPCHELLGFLNFKFTTTDK